MQNGAGIVFLTNVAQKIENLRVAAQVRLAHLENRGQEDPATKEILTLLKEVEKFIDGYLLELVERHPTAKWWKGISGCVSTAGKPIQPMAKIIGYIDSFWKYYEVGDPMIPPYVRREPEVINGKKMVFVAGIERFPTISKLWKYAGLTPDTKRQVGKKHGFNSNLKSMLYRLMRYGFLMQAERSEYYKLYIRYKEQKRESLKAQGIRVKSTPREKYCPTCGENKELPSSTRLCPQCGSPLNKKEREGIIWAGHLDAMARRWTLKLFLSHYWLVYRRAMGLPVRDPYPIGRGHVTVIDPWEMCDRP